ncbi:MAG: hypothetical protein KBA81_02310 [Rhabdochlamydiaceae bacterium]|nr:hypothetical protein [Rhabdochlamydiaceae bacterium]
MAVKFFINAQSIGRLGAGAVCYATADRLGLKPAVATIAFIVSSTLVQWSAQVIKHQYNFDEKSINTVTKDERMLAYSFLRGISQPLIIKIAQTATEKLGAPLSFVQCAGVVSFYGVAIEFPLQRVISHLSNL